MAEKTTYTLSEAAKLLSCHTETLRRAIKAGALRAAKLGRGWRISRADLEAFWQKQGGGALFADPPSDADEAVADVVAPARQEKPAGPEQLKLPT